MHTRFAALRARLAAAAMTMLAAWSATASEPVAHYDVDARFDPETARLEADVRIRIPAALAERDVTLLLSDRLTIAEINAPGAETTIAPTSTPRAGLQAITLHYATPRTRPATARIRYAGTLDEPDAREPAYSRERLELRIETFWLPVEREAKLFFTAKARIDGLPDGMVVLAQNDFRHQGSRLLIERAVPDNDLVIVGAPGLTPRRAGDLEFHAADHDDPLVRLLFEHATGSAEFHRALFGPPADGPVRMVIVPRASGGGYARRNFLVMPTFREPGAPVPAFDHSSPARFVAHEFNHAWLESPEGGGANQWIAESVAEYFGLRYIEHAFGRAELDAMLARKRAPAREAGSLLMETRPPGAALYHKGPLLLFDLEQRIGRDALDKVLARRDRPRTTAQFLQSLAEVTSEDIAASFERALREPGLPADTIDPLRYSVLMTGTKKGELTVTREGARTRRTVLRFSDRGRGPDLATASHYDERGVPLSITVDGVDYAKRPVQERFTSGEGGARWVSAADKGDSDRAGFYVPNESNAEDIAALARALLAAEGGTLPLLPSGVARINKVLEREAAGTNQRTTATLYFIDGLDLQPAPIWLTAERELFARGGTWFGVVMQDFEGAMPDLIVAQEQALAERAIERTRAMQHRPKGALLIRNATMFDAQRRVMQPGTSVRVRGDRIEAVGPDASIDARSDDEILDAGGRTLLPGLWDMHVHVLSLDEGVMHLMAGITTVRDLGNDADALARLSRQFDDGTLAGPHIFKAGVIDGRGEFAAPIGTLVSSKEETLAAVNAYADLGYAQVKLYSSLPRELVSVAVDAARNRGMRVSGHVPAGMTMREAVKAGYEEVQHANFWLLNFMPPEVVAKTHTPVRFSAAYERGHAIDAASKEVREWVDLLKRERIVIDPTLVVFENMFTGWKGELAPWLEPWAERMPAAALRGGRSGGRAQSTEQRATFTESFVRMKQLLKSLHAAGVPIVPGTDDGALQYSRELALYVEAGIPAEDVLYMATLGAARVMQADAETGSIEPGKRADMVLIDGDPLARIADIRRTRKVIKAGIVYDAAALAAAAGLAPTR